MCFSWNNLWSVSRYIIGHFNGWWRLGGSDQQNPALPFENVGQELVIHDSHFDLLPNYTFHTNITILFIGYLLIEDVTSLIMFHLWKKLRKVCNIVWCQFKSFHEKLFGIAELCSEATNITLCIRKEMIILWWNLWPLHEQLWTQWGVKVDTYASISCVIIGSGNGLSIVLLPFHCLN